MNKLAGQALVAVLLFGGAIVSDLEARRLSRTADTHERFATLRYDTGDPGEVTIVEQATADYWQARYDRFVATREDITRDPEPEMLLVAANAAYRASQEPAQSRQAQMQQLDIVLQAYASALKAAKFLPDAAYNYEYVARLRDNLTRPRGGLATPKLADHAERAKAGDLPAGPTIHGRPGGPPPGTKGEEFEIITPMEFGDREAQPEPNAGGRPLRKG